MQVGFSLLDSFQEERGLSPWLLARGHFKHLQVELNESHCLVIFSFATYLLYLLPLVLHDALLPRRKWHHDHRRWPVRRTSGNSDRWFACGFAHGIPPLLPKQWSPPIDRKAQSSQFWKKLQSFFLKNSRVDGILLDVRPRREININSLFTNILFSGTTSSGETGKKRNREKPCSRKWFLWL